MHTSGFRSAVPPNHAATRPDFVSAIVEAWHDGNGAVSKMNSDFTMGDFFETVAQPVTMKKVSAKIDSKFSLTLTLSRWEREQPLNALLKFVSHRAEFNRGFAKTLETIFPLPAGAATAAMVGEGEHDFEIKSFIR